MKRSRLFVGLAGGLVGLWASAAMADVYVQAYITKTKDLTVTESYDVHKFVNLYTFDFIPVDASSEQHIFKNQRNQFNFVQDENAQATASISGSATTATGIVLINQAPGFVNNQGNEVSVTYATSPGNVGYRGVPSPTITVDSTTTPLTFGQTPQVERFDPETAGVFAHAEVSVQQVNGGDPPAPTSPTGTAFPSSGITLSPGDFANAYVNVSPSTLSDTIDDSFTDGTGVVGVNQASGSLNNQNNALAVALGDRVVHALGEADLGQYNTFNEVDVTDQVRTDTISGGSFSNFSGVAMVNQSSGSINNQANVVDIAVGTDVTFPIIGGQ
jgi:hypothetical protein